jgi:hypothetical protein
LFQHSIVPSHVSPEYPAEQEQTAKPDSRLTWHVPLFLHDLILSHGETTKEVFMNTLDILIIYFDWHGEHATRDGFKMAKIDFISDAYLLNNKYEKTCISNVTCRDLFSVQLRGCCSCCWYWWNWWPSSLFKLSFHKEKNTLH